MLKFWSSSQNMFYVVHSDSICLEGGKKSHLCIVVFQLFLLSIREPVLYHLLIVWSLPLAHKESICFNFTDSILNKIAFENLTFFSYWRLLELLVPLRSILQVYAVEVSFFKQIEYLKDLKLFLLFLLGPLYLWQLLHFAIGVDSLLSLFWHTMDT